VVPAVGLISAFVESAWCLLCGAGLVHVLSVRGACCVAVCLLAFCLIGACFESDRCLMCVGLLHVLSVIGACFLPD
jgi:hypothetical protein